MAGARAVQWSVGGGGGAGAICHDQQEAALSHMHNTQQHTNKVPELWKLPEFRRCTPASPLLLAI